MFFGVVVVFRDIEVCVCLFVLMNSFLFIDFDFDKLFWEDLILWSCGIIWFGIVGIVGEFV